MKHITCIEDLRELARRKVPRAFFDYAEAGSYTQETLRSNRADLERIKLRQRVLVDVSVRDMATTILHRWCGDPVVLGNVSGPGLWRLVDNMI
jgi:L-lactate dehydrogenase (cytochrome)